MPRLVSTDHMINIAWFGVFGISSKLSPFVVGKVRRNKVAWFVSRNVPGYAPQESCVWSHGEFICQWISSNCLGRFTRSNCLRYLTEVHAIYRFEKDCMTVESQYNPSRGTKDWLWRTEDFLLIRVFESIILLIVFVQTLGRSEIYLSPFPRRTLFEEPSLTATNFASLLSTHPTNFKGHVDQR